MPCGKVEVWNMAHGERNIEKTKPQKYVSGVVASSNDHVYHGLLLVIGCLFISSLS